MNVKKYLILSILLSTSLPVYAFDEAAGNDPELEAILAASRLAYDEEQDALRRQEEDELNRILALSAQPDEQIDPELAEVLARSAQPEEQINPDLAKAIAESREAEEKRQKAREDIEDIELLQKYTLDFTLEDYEKETGFDYQSSDISEDYEDYLPPRSGAKNEPAEEEDSSGNAFEMDDPFEDELFKDIAKAFNPMEFDERFEDLKLLYPDSSDGELLQALLTARPDIKHDLLAAAKDSKLTRYLDFGRPEGGNPAPQAADQKEVEWEKEIEDMIYEVYESAERDFVTVKTRFPNYTIQQIRNIVNKHSKLQ